jgi:hypothetical protein
VFDGSAGLIFNHRLPVPWLISMARHREGLSDLPRCRTGDFREKPMSTSTQPHRKQDAHKPDRAALETSFRP